jgi:hypothetical protein
MERMEVEEVAAFIFVFVIALIAVLLIFSGIFR